MTVKDLIERLQALPQDLPVCYDFDGETFMVDDKPFVTQGRFCDNRRETYHEGPFVMV